MMMNARSNQRTAELTIDIPISLRQSLEDEARRASTTPSAVVCTALARHLGVSLHTLFQISTSGALVTGVYSGAITVRQLLAHGDFGLGTFEGPILGAVLLFAIQTTFTQGGPWYLVGLGATATLFALLLPRGLWGSIEGRLGLRLMPVGYRVVSSQKQTEAST